VPFTSWPDEPTRTVTRLWMGSALSRTSGPILATSRSRNPWRPRWTGRQAGESSLPTATDSDPGDVGHDPVDEPRRPGTSRPGSDRLRQHRAGPCGPTEPSPAECPVRFSVSGPASPALWTTHWPPATTERPREVLAGELLQQAVVAPLAPVPPGRHLLGGPSPPAGQGGAASVWASSSRWSCSTVRAQTDRPLPWRVERWLAWLLAAGDDGPQRAPRRHPDCIPASHLRPSLRRVAPHPVGVWRPAAGRCNG
jgi:hypothetical protein